MGSPEQGKNSFFRHVAELGFIGLVIFAIGAEISG
jgi:hypothetical protein